MLVAVHHDVAILQTALVSSTASPKELKDKAEELEKLIERIKDIKWVEIQAEPTEEIQIALQLDKMAAYGIGLKHNNFIKHRFAVGVLGIVEVRAGDHWLEGSVNERHFQTVLR